MFTKVILQRSSRGSRCFSNIWHKRIDDFTPVHINTKSDVHVRQYDWQSDSVEPKSRFLYPDSSRFSHHEGTIKLLNEESQEAITAEIPIKSPLFVKCLEDANADIIGHEANISIETKSGGSTLKGVKCDQTSIVSKTGDVQLNSIVSNCSIITGGNISARKIQGESLAISSSSGTIDIGSLYAPESRIYGKYGDIKIDNVHGSCKIVSGSGSVTVGSSQDNLDIKCRGGSVEVTLHDIDQAVFIESFGGAVKLYLSDVVCKKCMLNIQSSGKAEVTDEVKMLVHQNNQASAVVSLNVYGGGIFVGKAKSWGQGIWDKLEID